MAVDFSKFDKSIDVEGIKADLQNVKEDVSFDEVPHGQYEVKIKKMELKESKKGMPMVSIWFEIVAGEFKNRLIFMNQVVTQAFQVHICNDLFKSFDTGLEIKFENYVQYSGLIFDIAEEIESQGLTFHLDYGEKKGFSTFKILEVFENS
jgi:hypothetical protein